MWYIHFLTPMPPSLRISESRRRSRSLAYSLSPGLESAPQGPIQRMSPRLQAKGRLNSSRTLGKKSKLGRLPGSCEEAIIGTGALSHNPPSIEIDPKEVPKHNLCFLCRSGGVIRTCDKCSIVTACFTHEGVHGCLPEWALNSPTFLCPDCYKSVCLPVPYPLPSRISGCSRSGLNTEPLVFYSVFLDEGVHSQAAGALLGGQIDGYYRTKESHLLNLIFPYQNLGGKEESALLLGHQALIKMFLIKFPNARFILHLQTHASATDGRLSYSNDCSVFLDVLLDYLIGKIDLCKCTNALLFLNTCGGFIKHHPLALQESANKYGFHTLLCLMGKAVDPLLAAKTLFYDFINFYVIGNELATNALEQCAQTDLLSTTAVHVWTNGIILTLEGANLHFRPNGTDVICRKCDRPATYHGKKPNENAVTFRCRYPTHVGPQVWRVALLRSDNKTKVVQGKCRYILRSSEPFILS